MNSKHVLANTNVFVRTSAVSRGVLAFDLLAAGAGGGGGSVGTRPAADTHRTANISDIVVMSGLLVLVLYCDVMCCDVLCARADMGGLAPVLYYAVLYCAVLCCVHVHVYM